MELSPRQRSARLIAAVAVVVTLAAGTAWGDDKHFPFGPFRMFSVRNDPNGTIKVIRIRGTSVDGRVLEIPPAAVGLRLAEIEGQLSRFVEASRLAGLLVEGYRTTGGHPPLRELRITRVVHQLKEGRRVSSIEKTLGVWRRGD